MLEITKIKEDELNQTIKTKLNSCNNYDPKNSEIYLFHTHNDESLRAIIHDINAATRTFTYLLNYYEKTSTENIEHKEKKLNQLNVHIRKIVDLKELLFDKLVKNQ